MMDTIRLLKDILAPFTEQKGMGSYKTAGRTVSLVIFTSMCSPGLRTMVMIGFIPSERKKCLRKLLKE